MPTTLTEWFRESIKPYIRLILQFVNSRTADVFNLKSGYVVGTATDTIDDTKNTNEAIAILDARSHTHANKAILDATTASFEIAEKDKLANVPTDTNAELALKADLVNGTVPVSQLPDTVLGAMQFIGSWDADTNTPDIAGSNPEKGDYYIVSVDGTTDLGGGLDEWNIQDMAVFDGTAWQKIDNTQKAIAVSGDSLVAPFTTPTATETQTDVDDVIANL